MKLLRRSAATIAGFIFSAAVVGAQAPKLTPGLAVSYNAGSATDIGTLPNVALFVGAGQPATPFLPPGNFTATWDGLLSVDLRGDYQFIAELSGTVKVEANGALVYESDSKSAEPSKAVRLNKGTNAFKVSYIAPAAGDAFLRLWWIPRGSFKQPIQEGQLGHLPNDTLAKSLAATAGRGQFFEKRCVACHTVANAATGSPELAYGAPTFEGIGSRRGQEWMAKWIADPKAGRATARMPKMVHGASAVQDAADMAAFLATLNSGGAAPKEKATSPELIDAGGELATKLNCAVCHSLPGTPPEPKRPALKHVKRKFSAGHLAAFLQKPDEHYTWSRMPDFKLTADEAAALSVWLNASAEASVAAPAGDVERGRKLVQATGCLNCHTLQLENQFKAKPLADLAAANWNKGCLAEIENDEAPFYALTAEERAALAAFATTDRRSLARHAPAEFAQRQTATLQCAHCHGAIDGFPRLEHLGGKLRPEWAAQFIAGKVDFKPRNWIEARMPAFHNRGELLAHGMAALHGYGPKTAPEAPVDAAQVKIGQKLVSSDGGFSCIACHAAGEFGATQVFESAGVNFAYTAERMLHPYYVRWLLNPTFIDPSTKMPVYFGDLTSPLADVHGGDLNKQVDALWQYFRMGRKIPAPAAAQ